MKRAGAQWMFFSMMAFSAIHRPALARAEEVVAILSSEVAAYREAYEGFQDALGRRVPAALLSREEPEIGPETRVVVAFGGKAALRHYPSRVTVVYCMAPGTKLAPQEFGPSVVEIQMLPRAEVILSKIKEIQPSLKRLAVFWSSKPLESDLRELQRASAKAGIEILSEQLGDPKDLPERLRALYTKIDAVWLTPDPILVTLRNFSILKEFSWSNAIPFYVPIAGLVEQGATASVSADFREIGRTAAMAVKQVLADKRIQGTFYPMQAEVVLHPRMAQWLGLEIVQNPPEERKKGLP
ncbi:MAG: hypothetical protein HY282_14120 [Nitrospirae bacterium]|nr:hypothetical protein [Candidatus Manganitrophaceae bacterium]